MFRTGADWTGTFRLLSSARPVPPAEVAAEIAGWCGAADSDAWSAWLHRYQAVLASEAAALYSADAPRSAAERAAERAAEMRAVNPVVVPRRWLLERAGAAAEAGEFAEVRRLLQLLRTPFEEPPGGAEARPPAPACVGVRSGGTVPAVDAARLGAAGARAVEALEDAQYWRRLCPELSVLSPTSLARASSAPFELGEAREEALRASMREHGTSGRSNPNPNPNPNPITLPDSSGLQSRRQYCASSSASTARAPAAPSRALPIERRQLSFGN
jgi:hypothetical protein